MFKVIVVASSIALFPVVAMAQSAHYVKATGSVGVDGSYTASWKEAGLGNCPPSGSCTYDLSATVSSVWQCFNKGSNQPQGTPYHLGPSSSFVEGSFPPSHNGSISASLTLEPDSDGLNCQGNGLHLCLTHVSYADVVLTDVTFDDSVNLPGGSVDIAPPTKSSKGTCQ